MLTPISTINLILKVVKPVLTGKINEIEVKLAAEKKWTKAAQTALKDRVYSDNCSTVRAPQSCSDLNIFFLMQIYLVLCGSEYRLELL